jgi:hypothetical protein
MATFNMTRITGANARQGAGTSGALNCLAATITTTSALALNDVIQSPQLPVGAVVVDVLLQTTDLDTNGTPLISLDVGYGGDVDYFIALSQIGRTAGVARAAAVTAAPLTLAANDTIDILVSAAPATGVAGTLNLVVYYIAPYA